MKFILVIYLALFALLMSCSKKTALNENYSSSQDIDPNFPWESVPADIKAKLKAVSCDVSNCDSLIECYTPYIQYLYGNIEFEINMKLIECALTQAEAHDQNAHNLVLSFLKSPFAPNSGGNYRWSKRLRGEDAFDIIVNYMRNSKGLTSDDILFNRAAQIYVEVIPSMLKFYDGSNGHSFLIKQLYKYSVPQKSMEQEIWLTTTFIDILKKEIKEGRVVFKKYGE